MMWNQKAITLSLCALMTLAACGDAADDDNTNNNDANLEHPNLDCQEIDEGTLCNITGTIEEDLTLENDDELIYQLADTVFVGDDETETILTIEPGVTVYADPAVDRAFLTIRRNSKIIADGTAEEPIVFTPAVDEGERERGLWGGLVINGNAPINPGSEAEGEGNSGLYGGDDPEDDSGVLRYVRVEYAGDLITPEDELNGIAFQGVGRGTTVEYVQVHMNADDGVEFFGGTVNAKNLVLTGIKDDSIDWTDGWQGKVQFAVVQQFDDDADRAIEADNNSDNNDQTPRSHPQLSNLTLIGSPASDTGVLLRRGTAANIYNAVVTGFANACLDLDNTATFDNGWDADDYSGELTIDNSIIDCDTLFDEDDSDEAPFTVQEWFEAGENNQATDPMLANPTSVDSPNYAPEQGSPALTASIQPGDSFFEQVNFIGAVGEDDWTEGWTIHADN